MIDQIKIGKFLRELRKEQGKTQEEIAEICEVSSRSVSRWENGNTLPDLGILVELSDYYGVDVREIIDGERKSENMEKETKETLLRIADYVDKQKKQAILRAIVLFALEILSCGFTIGFVILALNSNEKISIWYSIIPFIFTISYSVLVVMNAKNYIRKRTK